MKVCARPTCGAVFTGSRPAQVCCSRSCARKHSPAFLAHLRSVSHLGGLAAGAARHRASVARWEAVVGQTPGQAVQAAYRRGYKAGTNAHSQRQYALGYEAGVAAMERGHDDST